MAATAIEWSDVTWNPVTGCDRVSPGCAHCYALTLAGRLKAMGQAKYQRDGDPKSSGPGFGVTLHPQALEAPLRWRKSRMVFVNSMGDLFHEEIPDEFIARIFGVMAAAPQHIFQVLTKRPERMRELLNDPGFVATVAGIAPERTLMPILWPLANVWLGVSIENRRFVRRADVLRATPAAVRFISAEPLLGPLVDELDLDSIDWLIAGGESGKGHRHMRPDWVRDLRDACQVAEVAFFFKQHGGATPKANGRMLDGRTWDELPEVAMRERERVAGEHPNPLDESTKRWFAERRIGAGRYERHPDQPVHGFVSIGAAMRFLAERGCIKRELGEGTGDAWWRGWGTEWFVTRSDR
jgi:protein gp37